MGIMISKVIYMIIWCSVTWTTTTIFATDIANKTSLIPRQLLFGTPDKTNVYISPSGKYISYLAKKMGSQICG